MQICLHFLLILLSLQLPAQYKGWASDCFLYFSDQPYQNLDQNFLYCKIQACDEYFFSACNHKTAYRAMNLTECMNLCCSKNSKYELFSNILHFLDQCETGGQRKNAETKQSDLYSTWDLFGAIVLVIFFILGFFYYEEILRRFRLRFFGRGETPSFEMRFLRR